MSKILLRHTYYNFELYNNDILKLDWTEETANMLDQDFKDCLLQFAKLATEHNVKKLWVDSTSYKYDTAEELIVWRKHTIIPKFQKSGVKRLAFQVKLGGKKVPVSVTKTELSTQFFETEESVLNWLNA